MLYCHRHYSSWDSARENTFTISDVYENDESPVPGTGINSGCTGMLDWHTAVPDAGPASVGSGMLDWHTAVPDAEPASFGNGMLDWHTTVPDTGPASVCSGMFDWFTNDIPDRTINGIYRIIYKQ